MTWLRTIADLAREAIRRERSTAGNVNLIVLIGALAATAGTGVMNVIQAGVRVFEPDYSTGLPSFFWFFLVLCLTLVLCVWILAEAETRR